MTAGPTDTITSNQAAEVSVAIRHIGRAMKALERAKLPHPEVGGQQWAWLLDKGHRSLLDASDKLIDGMEAKAGADLHRREECPR